MLARRSFLNFHYLNERDSVGGSAICSIRVHNYFNTFCQKKKGRSTRYCPLRPLAIMPQSISISAGKYNLAHDNKNAD